MPQSLANLWLHLIYSTKNRDPLIDAAIAPDLYSYKAGTLRELGTEALKINGRPDHVHLLFRQSQTEAISRVVMTVKRSSSLWIKTRGERYHNFAWQEGYGVFSVSESNLDAVANYIENQESHHRVRSFQDEYREFLVRHRLEFDEKFVWE